VLAARMVMKRAGKRAGGEDVSNTMQRLPPSPSSIAALTTIVSPLPPHTSMSTGLESTLREA